MPNSSSAISIAISIRYSLVISSSRAIANTSSFIISILQQSYLYNNQISFLTYSLLLFAFYLQSKTHSFLYPHFLYRFTFYYTFKIYKLSTLLRTRRKSISLIGNLYCSFSIHTFNLFSLYIKFWVSIERTTKNKTDSYTSQGFG